MTAIKRREPKRTRREREPIGSLREEVRAEPLTTQVIQPEARGFYHGTEREGAQPKSGFEPFAPFPAGVARNGDFLLEESRSYCKVTSIFRFRATNAHSSAVSSIIFEIGFPAPCPAFV